MNDKKITVIGAGLAGCEAAWQLAEHMGKNMKKIISIILICTVLCTLSGCDRVIRVVDVPNWELNASEIAKEQAGIILDCLKIGNYEKLEEQFCENISSTHDLKAEIAEAIEFIDGNIIDDGNWSGMASAGETVDNGEITKLDINPSMYNVKTDTGKEYLIWFDSYLIYKKEPNNVGIIYIIIKNENESITIGGSIW